MRELAAFLLGMLLIIGGGGYAVAYSSNTEQVVQPIRFPHVKHTPMLACEACHIQGAGTGTAQVALPKIEFCMGCHQAEVSKSPEAAKVRQYSESGQEVPWIRLYGVADDIVFSHQVHLEQKLDCQACHGNIGDSVQWNSGFGKNGTGGPTGRTLMDTCLSCHRSRGASTDCVACHK